MPRHLRARSRFQRSVLAATAIAVGLLSGARAVSSQQPTTQPEFRTEANFVRVDVYATRNGVPVTDLRREDFELFEDKSPQQIDQFTHIVTGGGGVQETRAEPSTVRAAAQAVETSNAGVMVLFLDAPQVDRAASMKIRTPLQRALARLVGPGDLIAVMTPDMNARDITFSRSASNAETMIQSAWGTRDLVNFEDPTEQLYARCYPGIPRPGAAVAADRGIAQEMILRRREKRTLDALEDLVLHLRDLREERKAIITVTNGWRLFGRNASLSRVIDGNAPLGATVGIDPRNGRLTTADQTQNAGPTASCERDRRELAELDEEPRFRRILDLANRANASFYPVDPRGMVVFDEDIMPAAGVGAGAAANPTVTTGEDQGRLQARHTSLRTMAELTDGMAIVEMSNLDVGLRRITADLSSYYLLGYYSNRSLDGKFHSINVRVKTPGVTIRARPGFLALSTAAATRASSGAAPPAAPVVTAAASAVQAAVGALGAATRESSVRLRAMAGWVAPGVSAVWAVAEAGTGAGADDWSGGGDADAMLLDATGTMVGTGHSHFDAGSKSVAIRLTSPGLAPGDYEVRIRAKGVRSASPSNESVRLSVPVSPESGGVMFYRAGPGAAGRESQTADVRFRRNERLRVAIPAPATVSVAARLLDRAGKEMPLPLSTSRVDDGDGVSWQTAQLALAPLAPGDYVVELTTTSGADSHITLAAFRVIQ